MLSSQLVVDYLSVVGSLIWSQHCDKNKTKSTYRWLQLLLQCVVMDICIVQECLLSLPQLFYEVMHIMQILLTVMQLKLTVTCVYTIHCYILLYCYQVWSDVVTKHPRERKFIGYRMSFQLVSTELACTDVICISCYLTLMHN